MSKVFLRKMNRWIRAEIERNPFLEKEGVINFLSSDISYRFKLNAIISEHRDWTISLYEVNGNEELFIDQLMCNAGHIKCLCLFAELLIRRYVGRPYTYIKEN